MHKSYTTATVSVPLRCCCNSLGNSLSGLTLSLLGENSLFPTATAADGGIAPPVDPLATTRSSVEKEESVVVAQAHNSTIVGKYIQQNPKDDDIIRYC
jgi:hypothetical protein